MAVQKAIRIDAQLCITAELFARLKTIVFARYPREEWATFFVFGFRQTKNALVITAVDLIEPEKGDLNPKVGHVQFNAQYSVRAALQIEQTPLCVGVVHSHPRGYKVLPSRIDDDMDDYYSKYFADFTKVACYCSLILAVNRDNNLIFSGRGRINDYSFRVTSALVVDKSSIDRLGKSLPLPQLQSARRLEQVYGKEARRRLHNSSVTIVGCGGTGSAVAHVLARAGVRRFVLVDYDRFEDSNLERLHGSTAVHVKNKRKQYKVKIVESLIRSINPKAEVIAIAGNILQPLPRDYAVSTDLIFGCTDTIHSRVGISELAYRYLVPAIDIGVQLDGKDGKVNAEVCQLVIYSPDLPCAYCRHLVDSWRLSVELMTEKERRARKREAKEAAKRGDDVAGYWRDLPELHTVGHLTTFAAALAATYGIGWLTGKFSAPASFFQLNLLEEELGYVATEADKRPSCPCKTRIGYGDQAPESTLVTPPEHWPPARIV